jgi:hypothetical protein
LLALVLFLLLRFDPPLAALLLLLLGIQPTTTPPLQPSIPPFMAERETLLAIAALRDVQLALGAPTSRASG